MTNRTRDFSLTVNSNVVASIHDSRIVILHIGNGRLYASNGTGARIWRGVEEQLSLEAIADEISDAYQIAGQPGNPSVWGCPAGRTYSTVRVIYQKKL